MLNLDQLRVAVAAAKRPFDPLARKHPDLKSKLMNGESVSYLFLALPGGQAGIDSSPAQILSKFPGIVVDDGAKTSGLNLLSRLEILDWKGITGSEPERLKEELDLLAPKLKYDGNGQVEIRFNDLIYELVWKLQKDDLVDRDLTPQTKASIRIVLGTLAYFARTHRE